jgi:hypothetical protein
MIVNQISKKSVSGFTKYSLLQYKRFFIIAAVVMLLLVLENLAYTLISYFKFLKDSSEIPYVGMSVVASFGVAIVAVLLALMTFFSATKAKLSQKLSLPISRESFAAANFINILLSTFILFLMVIVMILIETLFGKIFSIFFKDVVLINDITIGNFAAGLWASVSYVVLAASLAYCVGIYLFQHPVRIGILLSIIIILISIFPPSGKWIFESSIVIFSIKIWLLIIVTHVISYFPLRKMEVTQK